MESKKKGRLIKNELYIVNLKKMIYFEYSRTVLNGSFAEEIQIWQCQTEAV